MYGVLHNESETWKINDTEKKLEAFELLENG